MDFPTLLEDLRISPEEAKWRTFKATGLWKYHESFSWAWKGMFSFVFLGDLRFIPQIQSEDGHFGMALFAKVQAIKLLPDMLCIYRVRAGSISEHTPLRNTKLKPAPSHLATLCLELGDNYQIRHYHFAYSCAYMCLGLLEEIHNLDNSLEDSVLRQRLIEFLQVRAIYAFGGVCFTHDPLHIREILKPLEPYMQKVSLKAKLAYHAPRIFALLRWVKQRIKNIQATESI